MSGNPTKKIPSESYFIDTCIYINYGIHFDPFHDECVCFFNSNHKKHTSESVLNELEHFKNFMSRFSRDLSIALSQGNRRTVVKFPFSIFTNYNTNQEFFITEFLKIVKTRSATEIISRYRAFKKLTLEQISEALSKTEEPWIPSSTDLKFLILISYVNDKADEQILVDAASWAVNFSHRLFCTSDRKHILSNKDDLIRDISKHYGRNCLGFVHVKDVRNHDK